MINVSIIIPTYNRADYVTDCLEALARQDYPADAYEVLIVDDGSRDKTADVVQEFIKQHPDRKFRYLRQENKGPSAARNLGWKSASGNIIAFIDDDCIAFPEWTREISSGYESPDVAGVCGNVLAVELDNLITGFLTFEKLHQVPFGDNHGQIIYPITCNASFRKSVLVQVGGFDETFPYPGGEDVDLGIRMRKQGYFFIDNRNAKIRHYHKDSFSGMIKTWYRYGIGAAQWQLKNQLRLTHKPDDWGVVLWILNYPSMIKPLRAILWQSLRIANAPRDILQYKSRHLNLSKSILYFYLDFIRNTTFHIGQYVGYKWYKRMFLP